MRSAVGPPRNTSTTASISRSSCTEPAYSIRRCDTILLGPPFIVTDDELIRITDVVAEALVEAVDGSAVSAGPRSGGSG